MPSSSKKTPSYPWNRVLFFEEPKQNKKHLGFLPPQAKKKINKVCLVGGSAESEFWMSEIFEGGKYKVWCVLLQQFLTCFCLVGFFLSFRMIKKTDRKSEVGFLCFMKPAMATDNHCGLPAILITSPQSWIFTTPFSWGFRISNEIRLPINQPDNQQNERVFF